MRVLAPIRQHLAFLQGWRPGLITDRLMVTVYLEQACQLAGLEMVREDGVPNPVVSDAHKFGLGGMAHITTSVIDWMGWHVHIIDPVTARIGGQVVELDQAKFGLLLDPGPWEYLTVLWYTCGDQPDWEELAAHAGEFFGLVEAAWVPMLPELGGRQQPQSWQPPWRIPTGTL